MHHLRPGLLLLPALAALAGCSLLGSDLEPGGDAVRADTLSPPAALDGATSTWDGELQLPDGLLTVSTVTLDRSEVPAIDTFEGEDVGVADGSLTAVSWQLELGAGLPAAARQVVQLPDLDTELWLDDGTDRTRLDVEGLDRTEGFVWAAVADPDALSFVVEYDGSELVLAHDGSAAGDDRVRLMADAEPGDPTATCLDEPASAPEADPGIDLVVSCRAGLTRWPWLPDLGWAEGAGWRLVDVESSLGPADGSGLSDPELAVTLGGQEALRTVDLTDDPLVVRRVLVFAPGDDDTLEVRRSAGIDGEPVELVGRADL